MLLAYTGLQVGPTPATPVLTCVPDPYYDGPAGDPHFANVVFLLSSGDGFIDSSAYARAVTAAGGATTSTSTKNFSSSLDFVISGARATMADAPEFSLTTQAWTFECWVYRPSSASNQWLYSHGDSIFNYFNVGLNIWIDPAGTILGSIGRDGNNSTSFGGTGATAVPANTWAHIAVCRDPAAGTIKTFLDGQIMLTTGVSGAFSVNNSASLVALGYNLDRTSFPLTGYMEDARLTVGIARYTGNFVIPAAAFPDVYGADAGHTVLSLHGESLVDSSSEPKTLTNSGVTVSTAQEQFSVSSLYFNGSARLSTSQITDFNFSTGDFTLETWVYPLATTAQRIIVRSTSGGVYPFSLAISSGSKFAFFCCDSGSAVVTISSTTTVTTGRWWHSLAVRSGSSFYLFVDGVLEGSATFAGSLVENGIALSIGAYNGGTEAFTGYIDDLRITRGVARETTGFTAPAMTFCDNDDGGVPDTTPIPAPAPPPTPLPPAPRPITFAASSVATLSGIVGTPISSITLATITCADAAMTISLSETVPGLTFSYAANVLSVAGTPTTGASRRVVVSYVASDGSYTIRGSTEHTINIADAAVPFVVGSCASASGRVGQPINVVLCEPTIAANVPGVTISPDRYFPPGLLSWVWTPGAASAGVLTFSGTPDVGAVFSGTLTVTYRTAGWPREVLGTSTHTINIAAAYVAPPAPPAPAPAPPAPSPVAPPPPPPAPSPGLGADPFLTSVQVLHRFNSADQILQDVAMVARGTMTDSGTVVNITNILITGSVVTPARIEDGARISSVQAIKPLPYRGNTYTWDGLAVRVLNVVTSGFGFGDGANAETYYTSSLIRGYTATIGNNLSGSAETATGAVGDAAYFRDAYDGMVQSASGIDGADGNLAVECMVDIGAAAWANLSAPGSDQRLCPVLTFVSSTGAAIWMLGFVRSAGIVFPVFWRRVSGSSTGSFAVSMGSLTWRPSRFVHLAFCSEASGSAANTAAWFDGAVTDGGSVTLASLVTAATGTLRVGGAAPLIEWVVNTGRASTFIPFTGLVDEARITSASRYGAYIGPAVALPAAARVIPWPNY